MAITRSAHLLALVILGLSFYSRTIFAQVCNTAPQLPLGATAAQFNVTLCRNRNAAVGSSCTVSCGAQFLGTTAQFLCQAWGGTATWVGTFPRCTGVCPALRNTNTALYDTSRCTSRLVTAAACSVSCKAGFSGQAVSSRCQLVNGLPQWVGAMPSCVPQCPALTLSAAQYTHNCTAANVGQRCTIGCSSGSQGASVTRTCTRINTTTSSWSPSTSFPSCTVPRCPALTLSAAQYTHNCTAANVGQRCTIGCSSTLQGVSVTRTCTRSGTNAPAWTPTTTLPTCTVPRCTALPLSVAQYTHNCTAANVGRSCTIGCASGFKGTSVTRTCTRSGTNAPAWTTTTTLPTCTVSQTWPSLVPLRPFANKAWCPQVDGLLDICQNNLLTTPYLPNSHILVDFSVDVASIATLKSRGHIVICYISGGTIEPWRDDYQTFEANPELKGLKMVSWDEYWIDIRSTNPKHALLRQIMTARVADAASRGCQALEFDNVDCWINSCVANVTANDPTMGAFQIAYNGFLADTAHRYGMAVGLKNDISQIGSLVNKFDFAINEACHQYNECDLLKPFTAQNKAVLGTEYVFANPAPICDDAVANKWSWLYASGQNWVACPINASQATTAGLIPPSPAPGGAIIPGFGVWSEWSACSQPCRGVQYRKCGPYGKGTDCVGDPLRCCNQPGAVCPAAGIALQDNNCWNITPPENGFVWPASVPELGVARYWCAEGYTRQGPGQLGCYGGVMYGSVECVPNQGGFIRGGLGSLQ